MPQGVSEAGEPQPVPGLAAGTVVADRYRVESLLGEGGMGAVYRAEHILMRKAVALKVLHPDASEFPELVQRFEREAIAAANIAHPNVVSATDFGKLPDGSFFLVLEYVDGESLRDIIDRGSVDFERALHVIREIASALAVAHRSGVVHRDLKPENVMLVARESGPEAVKVFDFGIAKIDVGSVTGRKGSTLQPITRVGTIFGTPDYMAPEQAMGQPVDGRADLYSLGVMLYEMLTGGRPFKGGAVTLMRQHILQEVPGLPSDVAAKLDERIGDILKRLLAKDADARFPNAGDLVDAIDDILGRPATSAPPPGMGAGGRSAPPPPKSAPAPARPHDTDDEAPTLPKPSIQTWRPAKAAYSADASKRRRRIGLIVIFACTAFGALGATIWQISRAPAKLPPRANVARSHDGLPPHTGAESIPSAALPGAASKPGSPASAEVAPSAEPLEIRLEKLEEDRTPAGAASGDIILQEERPKEERQTAPTPTPAPEKPAPAKGGGKTKNKPRKSGPRGVYIPPPMDRIK